MAVDLRCPECGDNFGKDTENPRKAWCGDCQIEIRNPRGYTAEDEARLSRPADYNPYPGDLTAEGN